MPPRPAPDTPFTEEDLARLPQWAQRKVTWLSGQLARALELAGHRAQADPQRGADRLGVAVAMAGAGRRAMAKARITDGRTEAEYRAAGEYMISVYWNALGDPQRAQATASEKSLSAWEAALSVALARYAALPVGLTVSDEGDVLNWEGINYRRLDLTAGLSHNPEAAKAVALEAEGLFLAVSTLARIASIANEGLDALPGAEGVGDDD